MWLMIILKVTEDRASPSLRKNIFGKTARGNQIDPQPFLELKIVLNVYETGSYHQARKNDCIIGPFM